jgi:hypothetical protein
MLPALAACLCGCKDISDFSTEPGESYCGSIVQTLVRDHFLPSVRMRLHLDTDHLQSTPGDISTDDGTFAYTPLRPIPSLKHDLLSTLQFGEGRVRNLLFVAQPTAGAAALVVISLMENETIEVRVLRGAPPQDGELPTAEQGAHLYGVFPLTRLHGTCTF